MATFVTRHDGFGTSKPQNDSKAKYMLYTKAPKVLFIGKRRDQILKVTDLAKIFKTFKDEQKMVEVNCRYLHGVTEVFVDFRLFFLL